jgi:hypothetical protein
MLIQMTWTVIYLLCFSSFTHILDISLVQQNLQKLNSVMLNKVTVEDYIQCAFPNVEIGFKIWFNPPFLLKCLYQVRVITVFTVFRLFTDFVCLYNYEFSLSLCKIVRSSVILLLPLLRIFLILMVTNCKMKARSLK